MVSFTVRGSRALCRGDEVYPSVFADIAFHFREHAPLDRGYPLRVDVLLIYRMDRLRPAEYVDSSAPRQRPGLANNLFRFTDRLSMPDALAGVVKLLRE